MGGRKRGKDTDYAPDSDEARVASLIPPGSIPADGKLYYRIGEVSKITGVKPYVLRYWERFENHTDRTSGAVTFQ